MNKRMISGVTRCKVLSTSIDILRLHKECSKSCQVIDIAQACVNDLLKVYHSELCLSELDVQVLSEASERLREHASIAGSRICQDWSGDVDKNPAVRFTDQEWDDLEYNYQIENSALRDYEPGLDFFGDEMSVSYVMSSALSDWVDDLKSKCLAA